MSNGSTRLRATSAPGTFRSMSTVTEEEEALSAAAGGRAKRAYVRRIFSEIAPRYDLLNHVLSPNIRRGAHSVSLLLPSHSARDRTTRQRSSHRLSISPRLRGQLSRWRFARGAHARRGNRACGLGAADVRHLGAALRRARRMSIDSI